ncbi:MAG: hypothetical protein SCM96_04455 [Acidobacteriota bacterium]|nr:hypothetical protein [Acidobacteriota bacterium]
MGSTPGPDLFCGVHPEDRTAAPENRPDHFKKSRRLKDMKILQNLEISGRFTNNFGEQQDSIYMMCPWANISGWNRQQIQSLQKSIGSLKASYLT